MSKKGKKIPDLEVRQILERIRTTLDNTGSLEQVDSDKVDLEFLLQNSSNRFHGEIKRLIKKARSRRKELE